MRAGMSWTRRFLAQLLIFLVVLELGLQAAVRLGLLDISLPSYRASNAWSFWVDVDPAFGVWHLPRARYRHAKACFDVTYKANGFGMRDGATSERHEGPRVVVLGDSFAEGWGVADGERLSEVLERETGIEHLNFGTSGDFDPVQYWQLYRTRAKRFDHDAVLVMVLPDNDFPPGGMRDGRAADARWAPRLTGRYPDFDITYPPRRFEPQPRDRGRYLINLPGEFWLTWRAATFAVAYVSAMRQHRAGPVAEGARGRSRYYNFSEAEFDRLRYALQRIVAEAGPERQVLVVTIPRRDDLAAASESQPPPLSSKLGQAARQDGYAYLDLLPQMAQDAQGEPARWFHTCDGHWSPAGHAEAAKAIRAAWPYYPQTTLPLPRS
jgi:hypothetical protein